MCLGRPAEHIFSHVSPVKTACELCMLCEVGSFFTRVSTELEVFFTDSD